MTDLNDPAFDRIREQIRAEVTAEVMDAAIAAGDRYRDSIIESMSVWLEQGEQLIALGRKKSTLFRLGMWYADRPWRRKLPMRMKWF